MFSVLTFAPLPAATFCFSRAQPKRKRGWSGAWKGLDDSPATVAPVQNPEQISDGHVTTALHAMQDHLQQTTVIVPRRSREMPFEQAAPKKKGQCSLRGHGGPRPTLPRSDCRSKGRRCGA